MSFDHGLLNIPFAKRGINIDAEIDRFMAGVAREAKAKRRLAHDDRAKARDLLNAAPDSKLLSLASKLNLTVKATRARLRSECIASPRLVIKFLQEA